MSLYSSRCGTGNPLTVTPSPIETGVPGCISRSSMFFNRTSWLQGPFICRYSAMRAEAQTGMAFALRLSNPKWASPR